MDSVSLNPHQALNVLMTFTPRIMQMLMWTIFATFHAMLGVLALLLLWIYQVTPQHITEMGRHYLQTDTAQGFAALLAFAGLSGLALLLGYIKIWRRIYARVTASYLMEGL